MLLSKHKGDGIVQPVGSTQPKEQPQDQIDQRKEQCHGFDQFSTVKPIYNEGLKNARQEDERIIHQVDNQNGIDAAGIEKTTDRHNAPKLHGQRIDQQHQPQDQHQGKLAWMETNDAVRGLHRCS